MSKVKFHNGWMIGNCTDGTKVRARVAAVESYDERVTDDDGVPCPPFCAVCMAGGEYWLELGALAELDRYFGEARHG